LPGVANIDLIQYFFDTSALVKRYHPEQGTEQVAAIFARPGCVVRISALGVVEIYSALALKARTLHLTWNDVRALTGFVQMDISSGIVNPHGVTQSHFAEAEELVLRFGYEHRLRSLDAIQLAVASDLRTRGLVDCIVTADVRLQGVAKQLGFDVINPQEQ
jgi:predicted nucleic acid-binding protein